jgi:multisubunit Na+/H+ antiporter MnhB subunit
MSVRSTLKAASSTFGLLPGICIMLTNIGLPPGLSNVLFGGIVEAAGALTLLLLAIRRKNIRAISGKRITRLSVLFFLCFLMSFFGYIFLYFSSIVHNSVWDTTIYFPLWSTNDLRDAVERFGSRNDAITNYGPDAIRNMIMENPTLLTVSKLLLAVLYLAIFESLTLSFGFAAMKLEKEKGIF